MFDINFGYTTKEEIQIGDTRMRLLVNGAKEKIQLWSSLSFCWRDLHKTNVKHEWSQWKKLSTS